METGCHTGGFRQVLILGKNSDRITEKRYNGFMKSKLSVKKRRNKHGKERFEVIFRDGSQLKDEGVRQILVDKETGINYLCWKSGYGAGITPLLDSEGKVIVTK